MFGVLFMAIVMCGLWGYSQASAGRPVPLAAVALGVTLLLALFGVLLQMFSHPNGVRDWVQGGVVDVTTTAKGRVTWIDWAIAITRVGSLDPAGGYVKLERRVLFGLIPIGNVLRPVRDFYRVEVRTEPRYVRRRHRHHRRSLFDAFDDGDDRRLVGYSYEVSLIDRQGGRLCVLDLDAGTGREEEQFIANVRQRLEDVVGRPGEAPRIAEQQQRELLQDDDDGRGDDFEAWKRKKKKQGP